MTARQITEKSASVINTIALGFATREGIAAHMEVTIPVVNGTLTALRRNGLIEVNEEDGSITLTADATPYITVKGPAFPAPVSAPREGTKMAQAADIFNKLFNNGRQAVLAAFREQVGLTKAGAVTYYQTLRGNAGMTQGVAFSKKAPSKKKGGVVHK